MTTLPRWAEEGATAEELRLLEASRRERSGAEARLRTLLALGLGGPANGSPPSGGASSAGRAWRLGTTGKLAMLAVCGGAIAGAGWFALARRTPAAAAAHTAAAGAATASAPLAPPVGAPPTISPVVGPERAKPELASATARPATKRTIQKRTFQKRTFHRIAAAPPALPTETNDLAKPPVAESTLSAEVAALERAQTALGAHDAGGALRALDRYESTFPAGRLASEATVLRVQALLARGDEESAGAVADRFFTAHPDSSYARRIRDLLHDAGEQPKKK